MRHIQFVMVLALVVAACSDGGTTTVKCVTDNDCPPGQQCVMSQCQLPGDPGGICVNNFDCKVGEFCDQGVCKPLPDDPVAEEPDAGGADDGATGPSDDGATTDTGTDPGKDEDSTDYSYLNFTVAVARSGSSGPATQCVTSVRPLPNQGGALPTVTLANGYTVNGTISGGASAQVSLLADPPECVPAPVTADGSGRFSFYLPSGSYEIQAVEPSGKVAHDVFTLSGNTSRSLSIPATTDLEGGPLVDNNSNGVNGWTVLGYYRTGPHAGKLAHQGVLTRTIGSDAGMFVIPLPSGEHYDLLGHGPQGGPYPPQVLYEDIYPGGPDLFAHQLRVASSLTGRVTFNGTGTPGSLFFLVHHNDPRLTEELSAGTDGNYQADVRAGPWDVTVLPPFSAFGQGATSYRYPNLSLYQDKSIDIDLGMGTQVRFSGRLEDVNGAGVANASVRLLVVQVVLAEGNYSLCDTQPVSSDPGGNFQIRCNILPP